ncbi:MAG: PIN/TRAM domain-containing protein [Verrucomicrobiales bacterium]
MSTSLTANLLSAAFVLFCAFMGMLVAPEFEAYLGVGAAAGAVFGLIMVLIDRLLNGFSLRAFSSATFGLLLGFLFTTLLRASGIFDYLSQNVQWTIGLALYSAFGFLGMMLAIRSNRDEFSLIIPYVRFTRQAVQDAPIVLDTNIIIDGRIADLCQSGFLSQQLLVPSFVLDELQLLADAQEPVRRARGRRGLENLEQLKRLPAVSLTIHEHQAENPNENVDLRLLRVAHINQARIMTNDSALCKTAKLRGVQSLNLSDLERALRLKVGPGDEVELDVVKEGKDPHQGVGYLADGTMIVVNHAVDRVGQRVRVVIGGAMQTTAGRLYFAEMVDSNH